MLKRDRFQTETPNVIDPGECPPSFPGRKDKSSIVATSSRESKPNAAGLLYTRRGNKGALARGIPLRFVLGLDGDSSHHNNNDNDNDEDSDDTFHDDDDDEGTIEFHTAKTHKKSRFYQDEEENGIAQARLFAQAMLNESEKRNTTSSRNIGSSNHQGTSVVRMMHRASSFRNNNNNKALERASSFRANSLTLERASSFRSLHRSSSHRSIPMDSDHQKHHRNIWLVEENDEDDTNVPAGILKETSRGNKKKLIGSIAGLMVVAVLIIAFCVQVSKSQSPSEKLQVSTTNLDPTMSTPAPITPSGNHRLEKILDYLVKESVSSYQDLHNASSPQSRAATWLAYEDDEERDSDLVQRYALLVLYFALGGATDWTHGYRFASSDRHECSWYKRVPSSMIFNRGEDGVAPTSSSSSNSQGEDGNHRFAMGVSCNRDLRVQSIVLPSNNLKGSIPSEIQYLRTLESLNLRNNSLEGTIPDELVNLVHLKHLDLGNNRLTGNISPLYWIGEHLTKLEVLDLSNNQLDLGSGTSPSTNGHSRRPSIGGEITLQTLALGGNGNTTIATMIPEEIRHLTNLRQLFLDSCNLSGRIPAWVFHELVKLEFLDLSGNQLKGSISGEFSTAMQHLEALLLHDNPSLTGTLPESIGWMPQLTTVTIHHTNMTVGTDAANLICWQPEDFSALESLTTDCGDASCPCCIENCCNGQDCYPDVDWQSSFFTSNQKNN